MTDVCDFCGPGAPSPLRSYATASTTLHVAGPAGSATVVFGGAWDACPSCARLIDAGDRAGLLARAVARAPGPRGFARGLLARVQDGFWHARTRGRSRSPMIT
jgi:hypothetical protein